MLTETRTTGTRASRVVTVSRADLEAVYEYARQFGVDCDPSMMRVRALLNEGDDVP